ncbi:MAG: ATP-binding protein [Myxococcota bacterium]
MPRSSSVRDTLRHFDAMERINRVIGRAEEDLDTLLVQVLDELLDVFACDRAWLLYPCDPDTPSWRVPMERTRVNWPGAFALGVEVPTEETARAAFRAALATDEPVTYDAVTGRRPPAEAAAAFGIRTQMMIALRPRRGPAWLLGIHHCAEAHDFSAQEHRTFAEVARRMGDALGTLLVHRELVASVRRFRTLFEHAPEAVLVMDGGGRILDANPNASRLLGDGLVGRLLPDLAAPGSPATLADNLARTLAGEAPCFEWPCAGAGGDPRDCEVRLVLLDEGERPLVRASVLDVTEQLATRRQLLHLQKMEAVGELAAGVAHDFNNQLAVILGYAGLLRASARGDTRVAEFAGRIARAAEEAGALTRQLLAFSRRGFLQAKVVDLVEVVGGLGAMLGRLVGSHIELAIEPWPEPVPAKVDPQQLEQVIANLVNNARDAMPGGGHIRLATAVRDGRAAIVVADDGAGMDRATLSRIFEPFFTTKERGKGTGLGLSTAYGIVSQSGGTIEVESEPGVGTTFTVFLPLATGPLASEEPARDEGAAPVGTETVLVVEDRREVAEVTAEVLRSGGYRVVAARDGADALAREAGGERFDLLLTDVNLPDLDGVELAERMVTRRPDLPVLFCSGYSARAVARLGQAAFAVEFLQKPYRPEVLLKRVRAVLDRR